MGKFRHAPYYLGADYPGTETEKKTINSLLKSQYNRLMSKGIQRQIAREQIENSCYFTSKNGSVVNSYIKNSSDMTVIYIEFYLSNLEENKKIELAMFNSLEYDSCQVEGNISTSLSYLWSDFLELDIDKNIIYVTRKPNSYVYKDVLEWYNSGKAEPFTAKLVINLFRNTKAEEDNSDKSVNKANSLVAHGDSSKREYMNRAIKNVYNFLNSYEADTTVQDYLDGGNLVLSNNHIITSDFRTDITDNFEYYKFEWPTHFTLINEYTPEGYSDVLVGTDTITDEKGITKVIERRQSRYCVLHYYFFWYEYEIWSSNYSVIKQTIYPNKDQVNVSKRRK